MNLFFDTSALVKYFHNETGTKTVTELINNEENKIIISELAKLEFYSALHLSAFKLISALCFLLSIFSV